MVTLSHCPKCCLHLDIKYDFLIFLCIKKHSLIEGLKIYFKLIHRLCKILLLTKKKKKSHSKILLQLGSHPAKFIKFFLCIK